ncbi:MAG: hypothetical protein HQK49_03465 [Oligoflexia bacterium]|nr:hypothetical protein [Oligoflexia bacterium]
MKTLTKNSLSLKLKLKLKLITTTTLSICLLTINSFSLASNDQQEKSHNIDTSGIMIFGKNKDDYPKDVVKNISKYLDINDLSNLARTSKTMQAFVSSEINPNLVTDNITANIVPLLDPKFEYSSSAEEKLDKAIESFNKELKKYVLVGDINKVNRDGLTILAALLIAVNNHPKSGSSSNYGRYIKDLLPSIVKKLDLNKLYYNNSKTILDLAYEFQNNTSSWRARGNDIIKILIKAGAPYFKNPEYEKNFLNDTLDICQNETTNKYVDSLTNKNNPAIKSLGNVEKIVNKVIFDGNKIVRNTIGFGLFLGLALTHGAIITSLDTYDKKLGGKQRAFAKLVKKYKENKEKYLKEFQEK